jgi:hypothetical protein
MAQKTYDHHTAKFLAVIGENMPEIQSDSMQGWIENPKALQKVLGEAFCPATKHHADVAQIEHVIDGDAEPFVPNGWKVEEHKKDGRRKWDAAQVELYLSDPQKEGKTIVGDKLRAELSRKPVLNANVLDYLVKHPLLIPEEWEDKFVFFWGTIYRRSGGRLGVRCLYSDFNGWQWGSSRLAAEWRDHHPAALRAS